MILAHIGTEELFHIFHDTLKARKCSFSICIQDEKGREHISSYGNDVTILGLLEKTKYETLIRSGLRQETRKAAAAAFGSRGKKNDK